MSRQEITKLPIITKFGYSIGHVLNDMCAAMWFTYLLLFFEKVLKIEKGSAGTIMLIGQVMDGVATVFVGICVDKQNDFWLCNLMGKRKAWHLLGTILVMISFPFIFSKTVGMEDPSLTAQMVYYTFFVILFQVGWAAVQISHLSIIPDITKHEIERTSLTSKRYSATVISTIIVYVLLLVFLGEQPNITPSDAETFHTIGYISLGVGGFCTLLFHVLVKSTTRNQRHAHFEETSTLIHDNVEDPTSQDQWLQATGTTMAGTIGYRSENDNGQSSDIGTQNPIEEPKHGPISYQQEEETNQSIHETMTIKDWLCEPQTYQVACVYMSARLFVNITQTYIPLYIEETLKLKAMNIALIPIIIYMSGFVVSLMIKPIHMFIGNKLMFVIACVIGVAACLLMNPAWKEGLNVQTDTIYVIGVLVGFGGSTMLITSLSITAELVGNNVESSAFIYGAMSFTDKLSTGILVKILQDTKPGTKEKVAEFNTTILTWICGGVCLVGLLSIFTLCPKEVGRRRKYEKLKHNEKTVLIQNDQLEEGSYGAI